MSTQHAILTWNPSDCVTDYEVIYFETGEEDNLAIKKIKNETSVVIDNLKPCTNYKTSVYAIINDNYGELASDFAPKPARAVITEVFSTTSTHKLWTLPAKSAGRDARNAIQRKQTV